MTHASYNEALFEEEARVAEIYPIGMMGDPACPPDWLTELYEDVVEKDHPLFRDLPELKADADDASDWAEALVMRSRSGFLVRYEVCIRNYLSGPSVMYSAGWGLFRFGVIYVETIDEIGPAVLKLAREQHAAERRKAGAE